MENDKTTKLRKLIDLWAQEGCELLMGDIYEYSQGALKGNEKRRVERHLQLCDKCRDAYQAFQKDILEDPARKTSSLLQRLSKATFQSPEILRLIENIKALKSELSFPFNIVPLGATRGRTQKTTIYTPGDIMRLVLSPLQNGYVVVFNYDETGNLRMLFPQVKRDTSRLKAKQEKTINIKITEPIGKQWLKVIFTASDLIGPNVVLKHETNSRLKVMESILNNLDSHSPRDWMEADYEFEVAKGQE